MINPKSVPFRDIIARLHDNEQPFPAKFLNKFSDLSPQQEKQLTESWSSLHTSRKLSLLDDLEDIIEHDTLVDFTSTGKIALTDADEVIREAGLNLLWDCEDNSLIPVFIGLLSSDLSGRVRASAAAVLGHFILLGETDKLPGEYKVKVEEALLESHKLDDNKLVRRRALESLGYSSREEIRQLIEVAIDTGDTDWLSSALCAIGRSADPEWSGIILRHLDHSNISIREEAIRAAGELELDNSREALLDMVNKEEDDDVKAAIIWSLSQIGGEGVRDTLNKQAELSFDDDYMEFIEEAIDNLDFTEELSKFDLLDLDGPEDTEKPPNDGMVK
jgi:hypothetical protein